MWSRNGLPPPALSPVLLMRRYAPCRPVANASIYPRTCHAVCFLFRSSTVAHPRLWRTSRATADAHTPRQSRGTTAQASFCLEVAALRVGAATTPRHSTRLRDDGGSASRACGTSPPAHGEELVQAVRSRHAFRLLSLCGHSRASGHSPHTP
jgi:hypothetical protein